MSAVLRILAWALALALIALPVVAVVNGWIGAERWPLRTLRVNDDLQRVDTDRLRAAVLPHAERGFFAVRLSDAQRAVAKLPWVERAEVRKRWPDVLEVRIAEHRPFARWGGERLLSEQGKLFPSEGIDVPKGLPLLHGPDARVGDVVELYNESRAMFVPLGYDVRALTLDSRGSWSMVLSNGTEVVIGSQEARLRLARFARLLPQLLAQKQSPLTRADLRYTNGFALSWPTAEELAAEAGPPSALRAPSPASRGKEEGGPPSAPPSAPFGGTFPRFAGEGKADPLPPLAGEGARRADGGNLAKALRRSTSASLPPPQPSPASRGRETSPVVQGHT